MLNRIRQHQIECFAQDEIRLKAVSITLTHASRKNSLIFFYLYSHDSKMTSPYITLIIANFLMLGTLVI